MVLTILFTVAFNFAWMIGIGHYMLYDLQEANSLTALPTSVHYAGYAIYSIFVASTVKKLRYKVQMVMSLIGTIIGLILIGPVFPLPQNIYLVCIGAFILPIGRVFGMITSVECLVETA